MSDSKLKKVLDIGAILIAAGALVYSIYEHKQTVELQNKQTERAIMLELEKEKPYLQAVFRKIDSETQKGIIIRNKGAGPAKIKSFKYYLNQEDFLAKKSYLSWLSADGNLTFITDPSENIFFEELNTLNEGYVIGQGKDEEVYLIRESQKNFYNTQAKKDMEQLIVEIEYQSLNSLDTNIYFLRYCENFVINNIRNREEPNTFE